MSRGRFPGMDLGSRAAALLAVCAASLIPLAELRGQDTPSVPDTLAAAAPRAEDAASPPLPVDHWAARAAMRAQALGLTREFLPAQRAVPRSAVARALREAAEAARTASPDVAALAAGWHLRFTEEFREFGARPARVGGVLGGAVAVEADEWSGRVRPASGMYDYRVNPGAIRDRAAASVGAAPAVGWKHVYATADAWAGTEEVDVRSWEVGAQAGRWNVSVGEEPVGYGYGRGGGVVLSGAAPFPRAQIQTTRPFRLPGVLKAVGSTSFHTMLTRLDEERNPGKPWFWSARMAFEPHQRFTVGISRASVFGGDHITTPVTFGNVARMFVGILSKDFENQVVAVDARWRLPTDGAVPLTAYLEWGSEDASGAWWNVPGRVVGIMAPALPGAPQVAAGVEVTHFAPPCCGNPPWYFSGAQSGDWVYRELPMGHPLGGEGWEATVYGQADLLDARLRVDGRTFLRRRGDEGFRTVLRAGNLYAPLRTGRSLGGAVDAALRLTPKTELRTHLRVEDGGDWREHQLRVSAAYLF